MQQQQKAWVCSSKRNKRQEERNPAATAVRGLCSTGGLILIKPYCFSRYGYGFPWFPYLLHSILVSQSGSLNLLSILHLAPLVTSSRSNKQTGENSGLARLTVYHTRCKSLSYFGDCVFCSLPLYNGWDTLDTLSTATDAMVINREPVFLLPRLLQDTEKAVSYIKQQF